MDDPTRAGAAQPKRFDPARAARLDDPARFDYLAPAEIAALLDLAPQASLLDFGAGTGMYAIALARLRPDVRIIALDEQPGMLDMLRDNVARAGVTTIEACDASGSSTLLGTVDRIFALNVLHELGDAALRELPAFLRPSGNLLFVDWNGDVERPVGPPRDHIYGVAEARARIEAQGLRVVTETLFAYHYALRAVP